ncbi:hypothetical protein, partial [Rhizobium johnstonii]|uniref:hypothetical protein n=1 Tax=Rhizobium johnstonii TaxID=3019933 RepID=UPI003F9674E2
GAGQHVDGDASLIVAFHRVLDSGKQIEVLDLPDVPTPLVGQRAAFNYVYDLARSLRIVGDDENGAQGKWSFDSKFYRIR